MAEITRREFFKELLKTAAVAVVTVSVYFGFYSNRPIKKRPLKPKRLPDYRKGLEPLPQKFVVVKGNSQRKMLRHAVERLGGIERFVKPGERVLIKPNASWARPPEYGATTDPELVAEMVRLCYEGGAKEVWVTDVCVNEPHKAFLVSGIGPASVKAGASVKIPNEKDFVYTHIGGELIKAWHVSKFYHEVDRLINMPVVKHHSLSGCTIAMKNLYGAMGGRRHQFHQDIHLAIAEIAVALKPTLTVVDCIRILKRNGPTGGSLMDVQEHWAIVVGTDIVAIEAFCAQLLDLNAKDLPFLSLGQKLGLGSMHWRDVEHEIVSL